jgi:acetyltransferase-like isoleucine patch superfamily enzyme
MTIEVTRYQFKDRAGITQISLRDRIRSYFKLYLNRQIVAGENCIIKPHADIKLTDNAILELGDQVIFDSYSYILLTKPAPHLIIGSHVGIGRGCIIAIKGKTIIGDYTRFAPYCQVNDQGHGFRADDLIMNQLSIVENVTIGKDCWFGSGVKVLKGVTVGDGSIVGAGSVVAGDIPPYEVWAGVPAKFIKKRN